MGGGDGGDPGVELGFGQADRLEEPDREPRIGSQVLQRLATEGMLDRGLKVRPMVLPDRFIDQDKPERMYDAAGLNAPQIVATVLAALGREQAPGVWAERA